MLCTSGDISSLFCYWRRILSFSNLVQTGSLAFCSVISFMELYKFWQHYNIDLFERRHPSERSNLVSHVGGKEFARHEFEMFSATETALLWDVCESVCNRACVPTERDTPREEIPFDWVIIVFLKWGRFSYSSLYVHALHSFGMIW